MRNKEKTHKKNSISKSNELLLDTKQYSKQTSLHAVPYYEDIEVPNQKVQTARRKFIDVILAFCSISNGATISQSTQRYLS